MGKRKDDGLAAKIYEATKLSVVAYAEERNLPEQSLKRGYISVKTAHILAKDGIKVTPTKRLKNE